MNLVEASYNYKSKDKDGLVTLEFILNEMPNPTWVIEFNSLYSDMHAPTNSLSIYRYIYFTIYDRLELITDSSILEKIAFIDEVIQRVDKVNREISEKNTAIAQNLTEGNVLVFDGMMASEITEFYVHKEQLRNGQFFRLHEPYRTILENAGY